MQERDAVSQCGRMQLFAISYRVGHFRGVPEEARPFGHFRHLSNDGVPRLSGQADVDRIRMKKINEREVDRLIRPKSPLHIAFDLTKFFFGRNTDLFMEPFMDLRE